MGLQAGHCFERIMQTWALDVVMDKKYDHGAFTCKHMDVDIGQHDSRDKG